LILTLLHRSGSNCRTSICAWWSLSISYPCRSSLGNANVCFFWKMFFSVVNFD
jgi:hypothetical protein